MNLGKRTNDVLQTIICDIITYNLYPQVKEYPIHTVILTEVTERHYNETNNFIYRNIREDTIWI